MIDQMLEKIRAAAKKRAREFADTIDMPKGMAFEWSVKVTVRESDYHGRPSGEIRHTSPRQEMYSFRDAVYEATWPGEVKRSEERFLNRLMEVIGDGSIIPKG